jgi:hypothetical protein
MLKVFGSTSLWKFGTMSKGEAGSRERQNFVGAALDRVGLAEYIPSSVDWPGGDANGCVLALVCYRCEKALLETEMDLKDVVFSVLIASVHRVRNRLEWVSTREGDPIMHDAWVTLDRACENCARLSEPTLVKILNERGVELAKQNNISVQQRWIKVTGMVTGSQYLCHYTTEVYVPEHRRETLAA